MFKSFRGLLDQGGNAILNVLVASAVVGAGALMLSRSGGLRGEVALDMKQNSLIQNSILDMKVHLTDKDRCKTFIDSGYSQIGQYAANSELELGVSIESIREVQKNLNDDPSPRVKKILIVFDKEKAQSNGQGGKVSSKRIDFVFIQTFIDENNDTVCSSVETLGVDDAFKAFCELLGGNFTNQGKCNTSNLDPTSPFVQELFKASCESIGGSFNGAFCDQINLPASPITSVHLKQDELIVNGLKRSGFVNADCSAAPNDLSYVADGINEDGTLSCKQLTCPTPLPSTSNYSIDLTNPGEVFCSCDRDKPVYNTNIRDSGNNTRTPNLKCGDTDNNYCQDYSVDDGCNLGGVTTNCTIRGGKLPNCACAATTLKGQFCRDPNCGTQCPGTMDPAACGLDDGVSSKTPPTRLCSQGTPTAPVGSATCPTTPGTWTWNCSAGTSTDNCSAPQTCEIPPETEKPKCGVLSGGACDASLVESDPDLCEDGDSVASFTGPEKDIFTWLCDDGTTLSDPCSCGASVPGKCGPKNGTQCAGTETADTAGLCDPSTPNVGEFQTPFSPFDLGDRYEWVCRGLNGGMDADCTCAYDGPGVCGSANTQSASSITALKASFNLCSKGTPDPDPNSESPSWNWVCKADGGDSPACSATCGDGTAKDGVCGSGDGTTASACQVGEVGELNTMEDPNTWVCRGSCGGQDSNECQETSCPETSYEWDDSRKICVETKYNGDSCTAATSDVTPPDAPAQPGDGLCKAPPVSVNGVQGGTCTGNVPPLYTFADFDFTSVDGTECSGKGLAPTGIISNDGQCYQGTCSKYLPCNDEIYQCEPKRMIDCTGLEAIIKTGQKAPKPMAGFLKRMIEPAGGDVVKFVCDEDLCGQAPNYEYKIGARLCTETAFKKVGNKCEKVVTDYIHQPCEELAPGTCTGNIRHRFEDKVKPLCDPGDCGALPRTIKWNGDNGLECLNAEGRDTPIKVGEIRKIMAQGCSSSTSDCIGSYIEYTCEMKGEPPFKNGPEKCEDGGSLPTCTAPEGLPCSIQYNGKWYKGDIIKSNMNRCNDAGFVCGITECQSPEECTCIIEPGKPGSLVGGKVCF